jgi:addiction module HigA family antidote
LSNIIKEAAMPEYSVKRPLKRCPTHPGALLREDVLPALRLSIAEAAGRMHISRQTLHRILAERAAVTPDMALRLGKFCGNGPDLWLGMQQAYELWQAEDRLRAEIDSIETARAA